MTTNRLGTWLALVAFSVVCLPVGSGCGTPCGNLWQKLERCAKKDAHSGASHSKDKQRAFLANCKKSDKSRIKDCIKLQNCDKLRRCAAKIRNKYKQ